MFKYCECEYCLKGQAIANPYAIFQGDFPVKELHLDFDLRVSALCRSDCKRYNRKPTCPPQVPELEYYREAIREYAGVCLIGRRYPYSDGLFQIHWRNYSTNEIHDLLLAKELGLFKAGHAYAKAFIGGSCKYCPPDSCNAKRCNVPGKGRVPLEATGINVYSLMTSCGLEFQEPPIEFFWRIGAVFY